MDIIIVGCGKVGEVLAAELNEEGNNITVVDEVAEKVKHIATKYDIMGVIGNGATHRVQKEAGVGSADLLIAVTGSDELNLLCCLMAKKSGKCQAIARIKNPDYAKDAAYLRDELGLAMVINPEQAAAEEITRILKFPSALKVETFSRGRVELMTFRLPENSTLVGQTLRDAMIKLKSNVLVCTVERADGAHIPKGDFTFAERDIVSIIASPRSASDFLTKINYKSEPIRNVSIIGGGSITHYLCELLGKAGIKARIIEKDVEVCNELATKFGDVSVICGDPTDEDVLREERVSASDAFVALTSIDEENILLSLFAKNQGNRKVITKINRIEYDDVISKLDLDSIIYPKHLTANTIVRYVRSNQNTLGSNMVTLYNLNRGEVEVAEFSIGENSPVTGVPLSKLCFKSDVLVGAIIRGRQMIVPRGSAIILPGDSVVTVTKNLSPRDISDILDEVL
ncbi:MAG: Trk system potassium transporter TrkA [Clostridia bacterium]|nr:Trk system potassium transporter TrkA [Clostridia bacterium]